MSCFENELIVECLLCGRPMNYQPYPLKFYCSNKCKVAANRSIKSVLHPNNHASHLLEQRLERYFKSPVDCSSNQVSKLREIQWGLFVSKQLQSSIDQKGYDFDVEYLVYNWNSIYKEELSDIDIRVWNKLVNRF